MQSATPASTSSSPPSVILPLLLSLLALSTLLGAILYAIHLLRERKPHTSAAEYSKLEPYGRHRSRMLPSSHPAAKITPFAPRVAFGYVSASSSRNGTAMRIATRRADGVWLFSMPDPDVPFSPAGTGDLSPTPSTASLTSHSHRGHVPKAAKFGGKTSKVHRTATDGFTETLEFPPPAYTQW